MAFLPCAAKKPSVAESSDMQGGTHELYFSTSICVTTGQVVPLGVAVERLDGDGIVFVVLEKSKIVCDPLVLTFMWLAVRAEVP